MRRRLLLRLGLVALVGALAMPSCLSPTLPLPPPDVDSVTESLEDGVWQVSGTCTPGALITVLNDETGIGVVYEDRDDTGKWFVQLPAALCDRAWVRQEVGTKGSALEEFIVEPFSPDQPGSDCP